MRYNPFCDEKEHYMQKSKVRDPLQVFDLLTDSSRKAVINQKGELKLQDQTEKNQPKVQLMKERYWGVSKEFAILRSHRFSLESRAMHNHFPGFEFRKAEEAYIQHGWKIAEKGDCYWIGSLHTYTGKTYKVIAVYNKDFPFSEIKSYVVSPYIPTTEHRFQDGSLCLYEHQGRGDKYEKGRTTAVTIIAWTSAWLHSYEIWCKTGNWPMVGDKRPNEESKNEHTANIHHA